jgi:hypothetical protein
LLPLTLAWNPNAAVPAGPSTRFQPASAALTAWPDWVGTAFHMLVIRWSPPKVQARLQPLTAVEPGLRMVTSALKAPCHCEVMV